MLPERKRLRLPDWDYSSEGTYFLTLCTKNRKPILSQIVGRGILDAPEIRLYRCGTLVKETIEFIAENNQGLSFHNWVIMPNHVHILVSVLPESGQVGGATGKPHPANSAISGMVSSLKRYTNRKSGMDLWQASFYDHIIRDERDFITRWKYIDNNPAAWLDDDYYADSDGAVIHSD